MKLTPIKTLSRTTVIRQTPSPNLDPNSHQLYQQKVSTNFPRQERIASGRVARLQPTGRPVETRQRDALQVVGADKPFFLPIRKDGAATGEQRYCQGFQRWNIIKEIGSHSLEINELQPNTATLPPSPFSSWISPFRSLLGRRREKRWRLDKLGPAAPRNKKHNLKLT